MNKKGKIENTKMRLSDIFRWTEGEEMNTFKESLYHLKGLNPHEVRKNLLAFVEKEEFRINQIIEILRIKVRNTNSEKKKESLKKSFKKERQKMGILKKISNHVNNKT